MHRSYSLAVILSLQSQCGVHKLRWREGVIWWVRVALSVAFAPHGSCYWCVVIFKACAGGTDGCRGVSKILIKPSGEAGLMVDRYSLNWMLCRTYSSF